MSQGLDFRFSWVLVHPVLVEDLSKFQDTALPHVVTAPVVCDSALPCTNYA